MIKKLSLIAITLVLSTSCVSKKIYTDLENKYATLKKDNRKISDENADLKKDLLISQNKLSQLQRDYDDTTAKRNQLQKDYDITKTNLENLQQSYQALEQNSSSAIAENAKKNRELLAQLEAKEQALASENARLQKLKQDMESRSNRIAELESVIASKDAAMNKLKVEQRDGKVYVSMENKLLFQSGSWAVGANGKQAVQQLGSVLAENPDIAILIEGHTDNVPYTGTGVMNSNWDLSTKRATSIVQILKENLAIIPGNLTAAGRGEYAPMATNETNEGKAKNRRIEVILTPKLDEISKLLND